jgi:hypothetical protein
MQHQSDQEFDAQPKAKRLAKQVLAGQPKKEKVKKEKEERKGRDRKRSS